MLRVLTNEEVHSVAAGSGDLATQVVQIIQDNIVYIDRVIQSGSYNEAGVYSYLTSNNNGNNANWISASNGWLYNTTTQDYAIDTDGDGFFDYVGNWNGEVFSMYDGVSWTNTVPDDEETAEGTDKQ